MSILGQVGKYIREVKRDLAEKRLTSLYDVQPDEPEHLSLLQWNGPQQRWITATPDEIEVTIDGGYSGTVYLEILEIDGGGA